MCKDIKYVSTPEEKMHRKCQNSVEKHKIDKCMAFNKRT